MAVRVQLGTRVEAHRDQRGAGEEEDQRQPRQQDVQGDLVGRALADGPLDQGDHPVEERLAGAGGDLAPRCGRTARGCRR